MVQSQDFKVHHSAESLGYSIWADIHVHKVQLFWEGHRDLCNHPNGFDVY